MKAESPPTPKGQGILENTALIAIGGLLTTAAFVGVLSLVSRQANIWLEAAAAVVFYLLVFVALLMFMERYSSADWQVPAGTEDSNWPLRHKVSLLFGLIAVTATAVMATLNIGDAVARALHCTLAVIMSVSAANDFRRFRLPLPLTFVGLAVSIVLLIIGPYPMPIILLALAWAAIMVLIHRFVAKSGMAFGDVIALFWIALSSPFNGLLAVFAGQLTLDILARVVGWKSAKKRIPIGGAWLIAAALLLGFKQWPVLLMTVTATAPVYAELPQSASVRFSAEDLFGTGKYTQQGLQDLRDIGSEAAYLTGKLSFEPDRNTRIANAREVSTRVRQLHGFAMMAQVPNTVKVPVAVALKDLATALKQYDVDGVRLASGQLAEQRDTIAGLIDEYVQWSEVAKPAPLPIPTVAP